MHILVSLYLFILGLIFGSFILVVADRMKAGKSWVKGRSKCEYCKKTLKTIDLIPLFSWLFTSGKCRYCGKKLSITYPLTELLLGVTFAISFIVWPFELDTFSQIAQFINWLAILALLCGLFVYDLRWFILPNKLIYPLIIISAFYALLSVYNLGSFDMQTFIAYVLSIAVSAGFFYVLYTVSKGKWIGFGDVRLGVAIGLLTGNWIGSWLAIFIASIVGILLVTPTLFKKHDKKVLKMKVPFGPLLITGLYITVLFGQRLIDWYATEVLLL